LKCSQYNVKVFEIGIETPESFLQFLDANLALLANHLLSIHGELTPEIRAYLEEKELHYVNNMKLPNAKRGVQRFRIPASQNGPGETVPENSPQIPSDKSSPAEASSETATDLQESAPPLKIIRRPLRSGQLVDYEGSVLLTERINSGARVSALGSVVALGPGEGEISSAGECVIVPPIKRGSLLFHGQRIENEALVHPLNKIHFVGKTITIQPIKQKELF